MRTAKEEDWTTQPLPAQRTTVLLERSFSDQEMQQIRAGLIPEEMEDKWFIYWKDDALFFHRSWTGFCIYVARFEQADGSWRMTRADVNRDPEQYAGPSDERDAQIVSYLVDVLLLHQSAAFPSDELSAEESALAEWSQIGRATLGVHPNQDDDDDDD